MIIVLCFWLKVFALSDFQDENETAALGQTLVPARERPSKIFVLLGPEGGFSHHEIVQAKSCGYVPASLGPRILRAETASISACALIQHLFGDMR